MGKYFTYIIQSLKDESFYIGYSSNLEERMKFHNKGQSKYTSKKIPWKLVYIEEFETKSEAINREKFLKKQKNTEFYKRLIVNVLRRSSRVHFKEQKERQTI